MGVKLGGRQQSSECDMGGPGSRQLDVKGNKGDTPPPATNIKKKFIFVTRQPDGSKKQTILKPNDPRSVEIQTITVKSIKSK